MKNLNRSILLFTSVLALIPACAGSETVEDPDNTGDDDAPAADDDSMADDDVADDDVADDDMAAMDDDTPEPPPVDTTDGMVFTDFESWDGTLTDVTEWTFEYGPLETPYTAGPFALSECQFDAAGECEVDADGENVPSETYELAMAAGQGSSQYSLRFANSAAIDWGGGVGFWMGATDLSGSTGISFYVRGTSASGKGSVSIGSPATDADCEAAGVTTCKRPSVEFPVTEEWTQLSFPFSSFTAGVGADGETVQLPVTDMTGLSFTAIMIYAQDAETQEWLPTPGAYDVQIDDIVFY